MSIKILMLVGDYVEDYEAMVPYQAMLSVGIEVDTVAPDRKKGDMVPTAVHDFVGDQTYRETPGHLFMITRDFDKVDPAEYDGLYVAGGRAPEYTRLNEKILEFTRHFFEKNKPVAAICHGIQILTAAKVLKGRTLTAYVAIGPDIELAGGTWKNVAPTEAVVDGNLVTSPAWPGHPAILKEFYKMLGLTITVPS